MLLYPAFGESTVSFNIFTINGVTNWLYPAATGRITEIGSAFSSTYAYVPTVTEYLVSFFPIGLALFILAFMNYRYPLIKH